jgi:hypothetical protein
MRIRFACAGIDTENRRSKVLMARKLKKEK